jgi:DNA-binding NtrC family response regulator
MVIRSSTPGATIDQVLHGTPVESLEARIMELAMERTRARSGALFLWNTQARALAVDFHVVEGVTVNLPGALLRRRTDGRANGIAFHVLDTNRPHLSHDTGRDPHYARYYFDVASVAAVPIPYQDRAIGVLSVSSKALAAFSSATIDALVDLASAAAKFLRRAQLDRQSRKEDGRPFLIKGLSPEWLAVERRIERVSATDAPVLIQGESGTGKDLVARAIHFNSRRQGKPYIIVNCAAIPEALLESLLFGHVKGAFTGANFHKIGELKKADQGTLFLDEIGELPMALQAKLLRALEQGEIEPLGSNKPPERVDVRLLCATHRDLDGMVRAGRFRDDLYFRIRVLTLELPPLRRYKDNLEVLAAVFVQQAAQKHGRKVTGISAPAMALLREYDYPGNVRELKNLLEHAVIMCDAEEVGPADLPGSVRGRGERTASASASTSGEPATGPTASTDAPGAMPARASLRSMREAWLAPLEREYLTQLLRECAGNVRAASRRAGVTAATFYRLMASRGVTVARAPRQA